MKKGCVSQFGSACLRATRVMGIAALLSMWSIAATAADPPAGCSSVSGITTCVFAFTGGPQSFTVPAGVTSAILEVNGAQGGTGHAGTGGLGGAAFGTATLTPGAVLQINVGGRGADENIVVGHLSAGGWNGGANGFDNGGGGGATDIRVGACAATLSCGLAARLIVAGGGGGGGGDFGAAGFSYGGSGGGESGADGDGVGVKAGGATSGAGGTGGSGAVGCPGGTSGAQGVGGAGSAFVAAGASPQCWGGAGGGGGWYGGGGAGGTIGETVTGLGGGGGSGFVSPSLGNPTNLPGTRSGNGLVTISFAGAFAPTLTKSFGAASIPLNGTTTLTFTLDNPNTDLALSSVAFSDPLPAGLVVATPNALTGSCGGGTITAVAGSVGVALANATLASSATCVFSVKVTGTAVGEYVNVTSTVTSAETPPGSSASASLSVEAPLTIVKQFVDAVIPLNGTTTLGFTLKSGQTPALTGIAFTDPLPTGLVVAATPAATNTCGGTLTAAPGATSVQLAGATLASHATCAVTVNVTGTTSGTKHNTVQATANAVAGSTSSDDLVVTSPPSIEKSFGATSMPQNGTTTLSFTLHNGNATTGASQVGFTDMLPAGLAIATPNGLTGFCGGGTITATAGTSVVTLAGASLGPSDSCSFSVNVTGLSVGAKQNVTGNVSASTGTGGTATASVNVLVPPTIAKAFGAPSIPLGGTTTLTFTLANPAGNLDGLAGVAFTDTLPAGLVVATPNGVAGSCGGSVTAVAGTNVVSLAGGSIAIAGQCALMVNVTGTAPGPAQNVTGNVASTNGGIGGTATANLEVVAPPTIAKAFGAATLPLGGTTTLTFTLANPAVNTDALSGVAFTDTLPDGLVIATPNALTGACGGTVTATAGAGVITLAGGSIGVAGNCTIVVDVTATSAGVKQNVTATVSSINGGVGGTAAASVTVALPPAIQKSFGAVSIPLNGTTSLSFTLRNDNTDLAASQVAFSDTLPAGLLVATPNGLTGTCGGGVITAVAGTSVVSLSGASLAAASTCTFAVDVIGTSGGAKANVTGNVSGSTGTGGTAMATLNVVAPPTIAKAFGAPSIPLGGTTTLSFTLVNPAGNPDALAGVAFTDTLPAGMVVATPSNVTGSCGGAVTATAGTGVVSLSGGTIAVGAQCTFSVDVTGTTAGLKQNLTGSVSATNAGTGGTAAASLSVAAPPGIAKAFGVPAIALNGTTTLTFTLTNPVANADALTGVAFTDTLPAGLVVATPNGLTGSCGGTITATAGTNVVSLANGTIAAGGTCTFGVDVTGTSSGAKQNITGAVTSTNGGNGGTATANLSVLLPPVIAKAFSPTAIERNATSLLTFTITNPASNTIALTGVAFTDTLPTGLTVQSAAATVCGGSLTTTAPTGIALSGATVAANGTCQFSVTVTGTTLGDYMNVTGNVTSANAGSGNTATANLAVVDVAPPTIVQLLGDAGPAGATFRTLVLNTTRTLTFTLQNPNATTALSSIALTDTLPAGLVIAATPTVNNTCGGTVTAQPGTATIQLASGATLQPGASCTLAVNVTATVAGFVTNTVQASAAAGPVNTSEATYLVLAPPVLAKAFDVPILALNGTTKLTFTITNVNPALALPTNPGALAGIAFTDTLPAGLVVATPNGVAGSCGAGMITATAGTNVVTLAGADLTAASACTFSVNVTATSTGTKQNITGNVTSTNLGTGNTATANVTVTTAPTLSKAFHPAAVLVNGTTTLTFTIMNPSPSIVLTGVGFTDPLPAGLVVATPNGLTGSCGGGTITANAGTTSVALSGATLPASGSCSFSVSIIATVATSYTNTTSALTSDNGPAGNPAVANLRAVPVLDLDIDASGALTRYDPLTDGLLIVRYLLGVRGGPLVAGVLGTTASRSDADIVTYLDSIKPALDIDDDGVVDVGTDAVLIVRYLFGLRDEALVAGAVSATANRTTAAIEAYILSLLP